MIESPADLIVVFLGVAVLWLVFGSPAKGVDHGGGHRLGPGRSADDRHGDRPERH